jgi:predicted RNase H-like nuclease (RuvC/YqgF family)
MAQSQGGQAVSEYEHNEHLLDEIQRLRESNFHLRKDCEEQKQRIKRLEEAGDAMEVYCDAISAHNWNKAKEAKP